MRRRGIRVLEIPKDDAIPKLYAYRHGKVKYRYVRGDTAISESMKISMVVSATKKLYKHYCSDRRDCIGDGSLVPLQEDEYVGYNYFISHIFGSFFHSVVFGPLKYIKNIRNLWEALNTFREECTFQRRMKGIALLFEGILDCPGLRRSGSNTKERGRKLGSIFQLASAFCSRQIHFGGVL